MVHFEEFLLDSKVMVRDCQDRDLVLKFLLDLLVLVVELLRGLVGPFYCHAIWQETLEQARLDSHHGGLSVMHGEVVPPHLTQHRGDVQVRFGFERRVLHVALELKGFLQVDQSCSSMAQSLVVTGHVVVCYCLASWVLVTESFTISQEIESLLKFVLSQQINGVEI